jgi:glycerol-3-phosphate acyltransferase PlsY
MLWIITGIAASYLIGSIPTAYVAGKLLKGVDIRKLGSGNIGATNAFRVLGKTTGITVLFIDIAKGFLPVFLLGNILVGNSSFNPNLLRIILGIACIAGHNWTIFLNFKGGKGIATSVGVILALGLKVGGLNIVLLSLVITWVIFFAIFRIISLASVIVSVLFPVYSLLFKQPRVVVLASLLLGIFSIFRHKANILRLLRGEEKRLKF